MTHGCGFIPLENRKLTAAGAGSQGGGTLNPTEPALGVNETGNWEEEQGSGGAGGPCRRLCRECGGRASPAGGGVSLPPNERGPSSAVSGLVEVPSAVSRPPAQGHPPGLWGTSLGPAPAL